MRFTTPLPFACEGRSAAMAELPQKPREHGRGPRRLVRTALWSLAGVLFIVIIVMATLPVVQADRDSLGFQWVIFGALCAVVVGALVVLPIVTRKR